MIDLYRDLHPMSLEQAADPAPSLAPAPETETLEERRGTSAQLRTARKEYEREQERKAEERALT